MQGQTVPRYTLVIGNKNFSSWSMRAWLAMKITGADFTERMVKLRLPESKQEILKYSPSGMVPVLLVDDYPVWDSLAIGETLAEHFPQKNLWPLAAKLRAHARSICAEMHAGFMALRSNHPVDITARTPLAPNAEVQAQVARIEQVWRDAGALSGSANGKFLYGDFGLADAFYAPVVSRFITYDFTVAADTRAYMDAISSQPYVVEWTKAAEKEVHANSLT